MELSKYVSLVYDQFRRAESSSLETATLSFRVADRFVVEVRFTSSRLLPRFRSAIAHLLCEPSDQPDLTICVWGDAPAQFSPYSRWGTPNGNLFTDSNCFLNCESEGGRLMAVNWSNSVGLLWMRDFNQFAWWEDSRPFIDILHWWLRRKRFFFVHAAAVGTASGAALLVGKGGAGKSTTALGCLENGLYYSGDDFCLIGKSDVPYVYGIYSSAKVETIDSLPEFRPSLSKKTRVKGEKEMLFLYPQFESQIAERIPLSAILIPQIANQVHTRVTPSSHHAAVKALLPSTTELRGYDVDDFYGVFAVTRGVPAYTLELGSDRQQTVAVISELLQRAAPHKAPLPVAGLEVDLERI